MPVGELFCFRCGRLCQLQYRRNSRLPRERDIVPPPAENGEIDFLNDQDVDMGFQFVPESQDQGEIAMDFNFNDPGVNLQFAIFFCLVLMNYYRIKGKSPRTSILMTNSTPR